MSISTHHDQERRDTMLLLETRLADSRTIRGHADIPATTSYQYRAQAKDLFSSRSSLYRWNGASTGSTRTARGVLQWLGIIPILTTAICFLGTTLDIGTIESKSLELLDALWRLLALVIGDVRPVLIACTEGEADLLAPLTDPVVARP